MKTTTVALGSHLEAFVQESVATGRYNNVSEVIRAGVRMLEEREKALMELDLALAEGEASGFMSLSREELIRRIEDEEDTVLEASVD
jgi:antitoxin ParD1/3/4